MNKILDTKNYKYALVLVDVKNMGTRTFSYLIPDNLKNKLEIGTCVVVPFGSFGIVSAFIVGFSNYLDENIKAKKIIDVISKTPLFDLKYLKFLEWVSNYYICDIKNVFETALPLEFLKQPCKMVYLNIPNDYDSAKFNLYENKFIDLLKLEDNHKIKVLTLQKRLKIKNVEFSKILTKLKRHNLISVKYEIENEKHKPKTKTVYCINESFDDTIKITKRHKEILEQIKKTPNLTLSQICQNFKTSNATIKKLVDLNFIKPFEINVFRDALNVFKDIENEPLYELNQQQLEVYNAIREKFTNSDYNFDPILLNGVTGSGKTEIYFKLIDDTLKAGKNVIFLLPEIALASQILKRLIKKFDKNMIAIWHSAISEGEKYDIWQKISNDEIRILVGVRSAIFAPIKNLGLIIIDEEHESSYKQTNPAPRYNAIVVAQKLAKIYNINLLLGSATPSVETYYKAKNTNNIFYLNTRYNNAQMARVNIVDMREEVFKTKGGFFSIPLIKAIETTLNQNKQVILLINRRGFATSIQCLACGEVIKCKNCDIPLIYHSNDNTLKCHYCSYSQDMVDICPKCGSNAIKPSGVGTQRVEIVASKLFKDVKIARIDSDIMTKKNEHIFILNEFEKGNIDILIGTQMIGKGIDNKNVTLSAMVMADLCFTLPDYKAQERGFQILTQLAGRSGRSSDSKGNVYFQTFNPDFFVIKAASNQSYLDFYQTEIETREAFDYPPFSQLIRIILSSKNNLMVNNAINEITFKFINIINNKGLNDYIQILGPNPCIIPRLREQYRYHILIKNKLGEKGHNIIGTFIKSIKVPNDIKLTIDVEPYDVI